MLIPEPLGWGWHVRGTKDPFIPCACLRTAVSCFLRLATWLQREAPSGWPLVLQLYLSSIFQLVKLHLFCYVIDGALCSAPHYRLKDTVA